MSFLQDLYNGKANMGSNPLANIVGGNMFLKNYNMPNGGGSYSSAGTAPVAPIVPAYAGNQNVPNAPVAPIFTGGQTYNAPAPVTPAVDVFAKYRDPKTGKIMTPEEYAVYLGNKIPASKNSGSLVNYATNQRNNPNQSIDQLTNTATDLNNARNDLAVGEKSMFTGSDVTAGGEKIIYSPTELNAIRKAEAGIYDPALSNVFNKLEAKQKAETLKTSQDFELQKLAKQHEYAMAEKAATAGSGVDNYNGDFAQTIDQVASMESSVYGAKNTKSILQSAIANKDYASAYAGIANVIEKGLTGVPKTSYSNARTDLGVMEGMKKAIQDYAAAGGDMGLLKGTEEEIKRKLGIDSGKASALAVQLWREFQTYRNNMTGAAFGAAESRDYASVNPTLGKSLDLNLSVIEGAQNQLKNKITSVIEQRFPSAKYIREYAEGTTQPGAGAPAASSGDPEYDAYLQSIK